MIKYRAVLVYQVQMNNRAKPYKLSNEPVDQRQAIVCVVTGICRLISRA